MQLRYISSIASSSFIYQSMSRLNHEEKLLLKQFKEANYSAKFFIDKLFTKGLRSRMTKVTMQLSSPQLIKMKSELELEKQLIKVKPGFEKKLKREDQLDEDRVDYSYSLLEIILEDQLRYQNYKEKKKQSHVPAKNSEESKQETRKSQVVQSEASSTETTWSVWKRTFKQFFSRQIDKPNANQTDFEERQSLCKLE